MLFYGFHGVNAAEQELGQRFVVDMEVERDLSAAGLSDDIKDTVNSSAMYRVIEEVMKGPSRKLLENLAETIAQQLLNAFPIESVRIKVMKPEVPIKGSLLDYASVEIYRRQAVGTVES